MIGWCYIDNVDIYESFGVFIADNGYDELFYFPEIVQPDVNDWGDQHGIEADLNEPRLQPGELTVSFAVLNANWRNFFEFITTPGIRSVNVPPLGRTWNLRVKEMPLLESYNNTSLLSVRFVEDETAIPSDYPAANKTGLLKSVISTDGTSWDKYGIIVSGGLDDLSRSPAVKSNLTRTSLYMNGQIYDSGSVYFTDKQVTFKCVLNAVQISEFWELYNAFFGDLLQPGLRKIGYGGRTFDAYYQRTGNWRILSLAGEVIVEFDLTLRFAAFMVDGDVHLLSAENDRLIVTEDDIYIDMKI